MPTGLVPGVDGSAGYGAAELDTEARTKATTDPEQRRHFDRLWGPNLADAVQMDDVACFSVTKSDLADEMTDMLLKLPGIGGAANSSIIDATACVGGNAVSFARKFAHVTAVEMDERRCAMLKHNLETSARAEGKTAASAAASSSSSSSSPSSSSSAANCTVVCGDCTKVVPTLDRHHIVFMDPPWGGKECHAEKTLDLTLSGMHLHELCLEFGTRCRYVALKLPLNTDLTQLGAQPALRPLYPEPIQMPPVDPKMMLLVYEFVPPSATVRGIWSAEDEPDDVWRATVKEFGGMPHFGSKKECLKFVECHPSLDGRGRSNPAPGCDHLRHIFTHLVTWGQIEEHLIAKAREYDWRFGVRPAAPLPTSNRFCAAANAVDEDDCAAALRESLLRRLRNKMHSNLSRQSTLNTLRYLFNHMRCGIFVMIRAGRVVLFVPFVNKDYKNDWDAHGGIRMEKDTRSGAHNFHSYYLEKKKHARPENVLGMADNDTSGWWANGNIICNELVTPEAEADGAQYWGDHLLVQLRDMLDKACESREMSDSEFFINKRDYPQLKADGSEPYGFLFDRDDKDPAQALELKRERYGDHAPILSFYVSETFADIPMPLSEDWECATGRVFPKKASDLFCEEKFRMFERPWDQKKAVAFFRGNATGGGTSWQTNQRIHLAKLSHEWSQVDSGVAREEDGGERGLLDAALTGFNTRDKKVAGEVMTFLRPDTFKFPVGSEMRVEMSAQSEFKYIIYVEGHCAANRYSFLMRMGSLIIKVESKCVASEMWYFDMLTPLEPGGSNWEEADHVPVEPDLGDLAARLRWCRDNDDKCRRIVQNCTRKYSRFVSRDGICDYLALMTHEIAKRTQRSVTAPSWWQPPPQSLPLPKPDPTARRDGELCQSLEDRTTGVFEEVLCARCKEEKQERDAQEKVCLPCASTDGGAAGGGAGRPKGKVKARDRMKRNRELKGTKRSRPLQQTEGFGGLQKKKKFDAAALRKRAE